MAKCKLNDKQLFLKLLNYYYYYSLLLLLLLSIYCNRCQYTTSDNLKMTDKHEYRQYNYLSYLFLGKSEAVGPESDHERHVEYLIDVVLSPGCCGGCRR